MLNKRNRKLIIYKKSPPKYNQIFKKRLNKWKNKQFLKKVKKIKKKLMLKK